MLEVALTHPSAPSFRPGGDQDYERLEFLGDRVLGLVVAEMIHRRFPSETAGDLARRFAALVSRETLAEVARELGLGAFVRVNPSLESQGERENPALLADACEAVIAAIYLDGGMPPARRFIEARWLSFVEADPKPPQDAKTALQEWAQGRGKPLPVYRELDREGPAHEPFFTMEVRVDGTAPVLGRGRSKRQAEQAAAAALLSRLQERDS